MAMNIFGQKTYQCMIRMVKSLLNEYNIKSNFRKNQGFGDYILNRFLSQGGLQIS